MEGDDRTDNNSSSMGTQKAGTDAAKKPWTRMEDDSNTLLSEEDEDNKMPSAAKEMAYINVHLNVKQANNTVESIKVLIQMCLDFVDLIQEIKPTFKLRLWYPEAEEQLIFHRTDNFPKTLNELKGFFKGVLPNPQNGKVYLKIKASYKGTFKAIHGFHFADMKEYFNKSAIQAPKTAVVGWLLYSTISMDCNLLAQQLSDQLNVNIHLRWMRIGDNSKFDPHCNTRDNPKVLHIKCSAIQEEYVSKELRKI